MKRYFQKIAHPIQSALSTPRMIGKMLGLIGAASLLAMPFAATAARPDSEQRNLREGGERVFQREGVQQRRGDSRTRSETRTRSGDRKQISRNRDRNRNGRVDQSRNRGSTHKSNSHDHNRARNGNHKQISRNQYRGRNHRSYYHRDRNHNSRRGYRTNFYRDSRGYYTKRAHRLPRYRAFYNSQRYDRYAIGRRLAPVYYHSRYWIDEPWSYSLPVAYGPQRWVRHYDDVLLVDIYSGRVLDIVYGIFY